MAKTKQFTIAVDHQPGAVARIAKTLGDAKVNILCLLGTSQGTAGTVQLIVEDARRAKKALDAAGISWYEIRAASSAFLARRASSTMSWTVPAVPWDVPKRQRIFTLASPSVFAIRATAPG